MTPVTIQSNKIVLNEIKRQLSATRAIVQKKQTNPLANPIVYLGYLLQLRFNRVERN